MEEKRVVTVDVGDLSPAEALERVQQVKDALRAREAKGSDLGFRALQRLCLEEAKRNGWHSKALERPIPVGELSKWFLNIVAEAVEAWEDVRDRHDPNEVWYEPDGKPRGVPTELADIVIRVFDVAELLGIDLYARILEKLEYNRKRGHRHGGKTA